MLIKGKIFETGRPVVMGILNATPDSFYAPSRLGHEAAAAAERMLALGADILDVGAYSSRPGCQDISAQEEMQRLDPVLRAIRQTCPEAVVSVDTFRASVARWAVEQHGADIINDISGGELDPDMFPTVAELHVPYVLMHMPGTPQTMMTLTDSYPSGVTATVLRWLAEHVQKLHLLGCADVIVDPGFGFGKTPEQSLRMLADLQAFQALGCPVLAGMSRKSMVCRPLGITPDEALEATTAANTIALLAGASILRVHDVAAARDAVRVVQAMRSAQSDSTL